MVEANKRKVGGLGLSEHGHAVMMDDDYATIYDNEAEE